MKFMIALLVLVSLVSVTGYAEPDNVIGSVKTVKGEAFVLRGEAKLRAEKGTRLFVQDMLQTGRDGSIGVILRDDSTVSMGSSSKLAMKDFDFRPSEGIFSMALNMIKGTFVVVSGRIAKLAPDSVKLETPDGIASVRGTKLLVKVK